MSTLTSMSDAFGRLNKLVVASQDKEVLAAYNMFLAQAAPKNKNPQKTLQTFQRELKKLVDITLTTN